MASLEERTRLAVHKQSFLNSETKWPPREGLLATFFFFLRFYGPRLGLGQLKSKKELNKAIRPTFLLPWLKNSKLGQ